jgi:DNA modification methylase
MIKANAIELVEVSKCVPNKQNRNKHPQEQIERLADIIKYQGFRNPLIISNRSGLVVAGHGRLLAAKFLNMTHVPVIYQDFESEEQEYAAQVSDNAIASWAELDLSAINVDLPNLGPDFDINMLGIKDFVLEPADKYADKDADECPELRATSVVPGDLFSLGNHRLMCGDSTDKEAVERLMNGEKADMVFTDPPYGMNLDTGERGMGNSKSTIGGRKLKQYSAVIGDSEEFDPTHLLTICDDIFLWGADYYHDKIPKKGSWVVWDKTGGHDSLDKAGFGSNFELCWSKQPHKRDIARITYKGVAGMKPEDGKRVHPTQKPVGLAKWFFERWGKDAKLIVDLYLGSGSTLIACEKTNRKCYGMELDPQYCQVIIDRWEKFTEQKAEKIG